MEPLSRTVSRLIGAIERGTYFDADKARQVEGQLVESYQRILGIADPLQCRNSHPGLWRQHTTPDHPGVSTWNENPDNQTWMRYRDAFDAFKNNKAVGVVLAQSPEVRDHISLAVDHLQTVHPDISDVTLEDGQIFVVFPYKPDAFQEGSNSSPPYLPLREITGKPWFSALRTEKKKYSIDGFGLKLPFYPAIFSIPTPIQDRIPSPDKEYVGISVNKPTANVVEQYAGERTYARFCEDVHELGDILTRKVHTRIQLYPKIKGRVRQAR